MIQALAGQFLKNSNLIKTLDSIIKMFTWWTDSFPQFIISFLLSWLRKDQIKNPSGRNFTNLWKAEHHLKR